MKPSRPVSLMLLTLVIGALFVLGANTLASALTPLTITGVEPHVIEQTEGGFLTVYGSGFTAGTVVRLYDYGVLDTEVINSNVLRAAVPAGVDSGRRDIQVIRPDGGLAFMGNAVVIRASQGAAALPAAPPRP